jgi:hypothetical protein
MTFSTRVAVITSDEQALIVASDLAEDFKRDSAVRDRERRLPLPELEVFSPACGASACPRNTAAPGFPTSPWPKSSP